MAIIYNVLHEEIHRVFARDLYNQDLRVANSGCTLTSAGCRYLVRIWKARICLGLAYAGQIFKRLHFEAQSLRSVTQPVQVLEVLIFGDVRFIEQKADFTGALVNEATDIPEHKVFGERRL